MLLRENRRQPIRFLPWPLIPNPEIPNPSLPMPRILITSGPTRQYLDPVRYLTNASSGRMGEALATAAVDAGHEVVVVSGPVDVAYPPAAEVVPVVSTEEMLEACLDVFPTCDGLIAVAAPCDYRPMVVAPHKIRKTGEPLQLHLVETPDVALMVSYDEVTSISPVTASGTMIASRFRAWVAEILTLLVRVLKASSAKLTS